LVFYPKPDVSDVLCLFDSARDSEMLVLDD